MKKPCAPQMLFCFDSPLFICCCFLIVTRFFNEDLKLFRARGGWKKKLLRLFNSSATKYKNYFKKRIPPNQHADIAILCAKEHHNALFMKLLRHLALIGHPLIQRRSVVDVSSIRSFGVIVDLNKLEKPEDLDLTIRAYMYVRDYRRATFSRKLVRKTNLWV